MSWIEDFTKEQERWLEHHKEQETRWKVSYQNKWDYSGIDHYDSSLDELEKQGYWQKNRQAMPRNRFGQPLFSPKCTHCLEHEEHFMDCNLCGDKVVVERLHGGAAYDAGAVHWITSDTWVDEFVHDCPKTRQYLNLLLYAILS